MKWGDRREGRIHRKQGVVGNVDPRRTTHTRRIHSMEPPRTRWHVSSRERALEPTHGSSPNRRRSLREPQKTGTSRRTRNGRSRRGLERFADSTGRLDYESERVAVHHVIELTLRQQNLARAHPFEHIRSHISNVNRSAFPLYLGGDYTSFV